MKILIAQDYLRSGGTERQSIFLANAFARLGHEVTLLTFRPAGQLEETISSEVRRISLQTNDRGLDWWAPGLVRKVQSVGPAIVLCMGRMANSWAGRIARIRRGSASGPVVVGTMRTGKALPWFFRRSLRLVDHVVANSRDSERVLIERYHVPAEKVSVIYNALVALPTEAAIFAANFNRPIRLLHVGMFRPEKNQRELIELCARLPKDVAWQLELAGAGEELENCRKLANDLGLFDRVVFSGYVAHPQELYRRADVAVMASKSESLSNFLIEAHAHGLPSVAYRAAGVEECGGYVVPAGDRDAFLAALLPLIRDDALRGREAERVRTHALKSFSPAAQVEQYLRLFARLVAR